ncbi:MAG: hypothetical protein NVS3B12_00760 [Acidimicrobiales bacterium]
MNRRVMAASLTGLAFVALLGGCTKGSQDKKMLQAALERTQRMSGRFLYAEHADDADRVVKGIVADDLRYKAELAVNGSPTVQEVVSDDAVADLFVDPQAVPLLARRGADGKLLDAPADDAVPGPTGISVVDALATRRWVLDPVGAPDVFAKGTKHPIGEDPIFDARDIFAYTLRAVDQAAAIQRFDPESIDPAFKAKNDHFPRPAHGAKLIRYDLRAPHLPRKDSTQGSGSNQRVPEAANFRRMSVFVRNGVVQRIMEEIDVVSELDDLKRTYSLKLDGPPERQATAAIEGINAVRLGQGNDFIRPRTMDFQLVDQGKPLEVALPTDAIVGPLHVLVNRGKALPKSGGVAAPSAGSGAGAPPPPPGAAGG